MAKDKNLFMLTIGMSLLLAGFQSTQQFVTMKYSEAGNISTGYLSLTLIYLFFFLGSLFTPVIHSRFGSKNAIIAASLFYILYIIAIAFGQGILVIAASILLGVAASVLWSGHSVYIGLISDEKNRLSKISYFWSIYSLFSCVFIPLAGFIIIITSYEFTFYLYTFIALMSLPTIMIIQDKRETSNNTKQVPILKSRTINKIAFGFFISGIIYGLAISFIPIHISLISGKAYIGLMSAPFFVVPVFSLYISNKFDKHLSRARTILTSFAAASVGFLVLYISNSTQILFCGIILITIGYTILQSVITATILDIRPENLLARASATLTANRSLGIAFGIFTSLLFNDKNIYLLVLLIILIASVTIFPLRSLSIETMRKIVADEIEAKSN
jgi:MFS family permease